ncbi:MAG TPA: YebC/PmpR family DNA-binding transcriptional regulator [Candidatus Deferrimicrobiaceae bacterium]|nr:YebC/PmpR family DNA-binding transcriptional regulator [Candidatus Deferrimicrobiaceae bacterium]
MSGHNKWSSIKHRKGKADAQRGKIFTKITRELITAAKIGGGDPDGNSRLRQAVLAARAVNMPNDNIARAIKKGTGELEGISYEELLYEGYGPHGVAVLVKVLTDNKNRTVADVRHIFSKHNGNLGETGCVSWMFTKKGSVTVPKGAVPEEKLIELAIELGAEDVVSDPEAHEYEVRCGPEDLDDLKRGLEEKGVKINTAEVAMLPQSTVHLEGKAADQMLRLMNALEESDDVQNVWANFDISDEAMEAFGG